MKENKFSSKIFRHPIGFSWLKFFVVLLGALGCLGVLVISRGNEAEKYYFIRQFYWFVFSSLMLFVVARVNLEFSEKGALLFYAGSLLILFFVLLFGVRINGMRGWFQWRSIGIQPGELLKPVFILIFAKLLSEERFTPGKCKGFLGCLLLLAPWLALLLLQPDAGTALIYCLTFLAMLWVAGVGLWQLPLIAISCVPMAAWALWRYPYMRKRLLAFVSSSPDVLQSSGWHASVMAKSLESGGWFGKLFNPDPTLIRVPYRMNDSIFAVLSEQLGFFGMLPLILLTFCWLAFCCLCAYRSNSKQQQLLFVACGVMLSGQAILHLAVNLGLFPTTGITFPLVSYGGSSLLASFCIAGIVENCRK
jgi:cell division protein FtsW (lipid II flippase)